MKFLHSMKRMSADMFKATEYLQPVFIINSVCALKALFIM